VHVLLGLAVATVLVIGWGFGNLFACVFLSLPGGLLALYSLLFINTGAGFLGFLACAAVLLGVWGQFYLGVWEQFYIADTRRTA
jgi:hypothetical protein